MMEENAQKIAGAICNLLDEFGDIETAAVLTGVSAVLIAIANEMNMSEEDSIEAFSQCLRASKEVTRNYSFRPH